MGIPVEVPGLDVILPSIGDGQVIVIESGLDGAKSFFVRRLAQSALARGSPVTFLVSRDRDETDRFLQSTPRLIENGHAPFEVLEEDSLKDLQPAASSGGVLAIDSFSFMSLDTPPARMAPILRGLRSVCQQRGTTALLGTDRGMFDARSEAIAMHLADGVIQFHSKEGPEGPVRYLRIPKWTEGKFVDRNVYYEFDGHRIAIDLRSRVL